MKVSELVEKLLKIDQSLEVKKRVWHYSSVEDSGWEEDLDIDEVKNSLEYTQGTTIPIVTL
jgi:hypothetical protein